MDVLKEKKNILLKTKNHILRMPENKKRVDMIEAYLSLLKYYMIISGQENIDEKLDIDHEYTKKNEDYIISDTKKWIVELEKNAKVLCDKYQDIIDTYRENEFCEYQSIVANKINKNKMDEAIWYFFASLGEDVLKIYYDMIMGGNIYLNNGSMERLGYALDSRPLDNACITVRNIPYYLDFYITLAHEIGHCYQFYLQKNQRNYAHFEPYSEVTSTLFEKLFVEYLKKTHMLKDTSSVILENHIAFLDNVSISKILCKLLMENKIDIIDPFSLAYRCKISEEEIKKEIINDCGYVKPISLEPELSEIYYSFGNIIATFFMKKILNDFESGWKEFKDFICTVNYLPMSDVINEYFDIDLVKNEIKKLTKSYQTR